MRHALSTAAGIRSTEAELITMARLQGKSKIGLYTRVVLPSSVPMIFAGIRLSVTYAMLGVVASEMIAAKNGLGVQLVKYSNFLNISAVFAILLVLALLGTVLAWILDRAERRFLRWQ